MFTYEKLLDLINTEIRARTGMLRQKHPVKLYLPVEYSLEMGGKRLRPVMLLLSFNLFSDEIEKAIPAALAIEVFHNFTLLHDDIMDKADVRRNRPAVHKMFSENGAILSGDVMAFVSYGFLLEKPHEKIIDVARLFTQTAIEVCEGQQLDMDFESRMDVTENEYLEMIRLKTAVLLGCSMKAGALTGGATDATARKLYDYGLSLGMAFQLQDDLLDTFGDRETFGKKIGGDIQANKKTYLLIKTLELASPMRRKELYAWMTTAEPDPEEKIRAVKKIFEETGIREITIRKINEYYHEAERILDTLDVAVTRKEHLLKLGEKMGKRES